MEGRGNTLPHEESKTFLKGAFILSLGAFITKILSAVYRVPFQNIVGDIGFYIYQQVYPIYGIVIALATYGFPVILSRLIAENRTYGKAESEKEIINASFVLLSAVGVILFLCVFLGSYNLAEWMGDLTLRTLIRTIAFSFLLLPFVSVFRGYFQGNSNMLPTAVSQVIEQLIRVMTIIILSAYLVSKGYSLYVAGTGAIAGSITGGSCAFIVLFILYLKDSNHPGFTVSGLSLPVYRRVAKALFIEGFAVCISGALLVLIQFIDSLNLFSLLVHSGVPANEAKAIKGVYDRGQPFIQLGTVAATSISLALVPMITQEYRQGNSAALNEKMSIALKMSIIIGLGASAGLINLIRPANIMLFENDKGSAVLAVFSISIFLSSIILTITGVLQGMRKVYSPAVYILLGIIIKYFGNEYFVPKYGTMGAAIATVVSLGIIAVLFIMKMRRLGISMLSARFYGKLAAAVCLMTLVLQAFLLITRSVHFTGRGMNAGIALAGVAAGGMVYIWSVIRFNLLDDRDLYLLPFGEKLLRIKKIME
jgi:polysaccharide transporter, PST family